MTEWDKRYFNVAKEVASWSKDPSRKTGCFFNEELHKSVAVLGGKVQGKKNAENGHLKLIANQYWADVRNGLKIRKKDIGLTMELKV